MRSVVHQREEWVVSDPQTDAAKGGIKSVCSSERPAKGASRPKI
jgi:hypothetical protein